MPHGMVGHPKSVAVISGPDDGDVKWGKGLYGDSDNQYVFC